MDPIELFLRNALKEKAFEDRLIRRALADLRSTLAAVERTIEASGALGLGLNREARITAVANAVARSVQQTWGIPQLAELQTALEPFIRTQMDFARDMVQAAGGPLPAAGTATVNTAQTVNNAIVGGKTLSTTLTQSFPALVADRVERYIRLGLNQVSGEVLETIQYKDAVVTVTERNVEAIIRTAVQEVGSAAQMAIYEFEADPDWLEGKLTWTAVLDSAVCPVCLALDGKEYEIGTVGPYFDGRNKINPHMQCVLGDTRIDAGIVAAGMRAEYSGQVVTIGTQRGRVLSVTENHPVLTTDGWKAAKSLQEGDQLICRRVKAESIVDPSFNQCPPTAEELFALLKHQAAVSSGSVPAAAMDFHGDGAGIHGNVDIACVNRHLLVNDESVCLEHFSDSLFSVTDSGLTLVGDLGAVDTLLLALHATASGFVSASDLVLALLCGHGAPFERLSLALSARRDPCFDQPPANGVTRNAKLLRDLVFAQAGAVEVDDVAVVKSESKHEVPVYDFTSVSGAYFASDILTHNCRCSLLPSKWKQDMISPEGQTVSVRRPADGDRGEVAITFKTAAKQWVKNNPETAQAIFGKKLGQQLARGDITFDRAVKQWQEPKRAT